MNKTTRNILIIVVIVLLAFGIILAVYNHFKTEPIDANMANENILDDANTGLDNIINDILDEDNVENAENEEEAKNTENEKTNTQASSSKTNTQSSKNDNKVDLESTSGEKKAIELAKKEWKKEWGNLNDVSFNNVMVQGDGKYVVSVNDSTTTEVIRFYVVDIKTGIVEEK